VILDTNALSAWADGDPAIEPLLRTASRLVIPVVVIGEFEFGIRQSRHASRYAEWLAVNLDTVDVARIDRAIAAVYGAVRLELKQAGTPIPINDSWIASVARHERLPIISRDGHFDAVRGVERVSW
jgi:tRNA(fMet)-specific endonuclease VapC